MVGVQPETIAVTRNRAINYRNINTIIKRSIIQVKRCEKPSGREVSYDTLHVGAQQD